MVESTITNSNIIKGRLLFDANSKVIIKDVEILLIGMASPIVIITELDKTESSALFSHTIEAQARAGDYKVTWNISINGIDTEIIDGFTINGDGIDRTIPMELRHLS